MEIRGIQPSRTIGIKDKVVSNKSGFSENFMKSYKSATKEELENYIKDIKKKGNKLILTKISKLNLYPKAFPLLLLKVL